MYIAAIFIFIIAAICFINIKVKIYFCLATSEFITEITVAGIKIKIKRKPRKKVKSPYDVVKFIAQSIRVEYFKLNILLGFDDPIADVFAVQFLRNIFGSVYCLFKSAFTKKTKLFVRIMPAFNQKILNINFNCIINVKTGYIIKAYAKHYKNKIKKYIKNIIRRSFT